MKAGYDVPRLLCCAVSIPTLVFDHASKCPASVPYCTVSVEFARTTDVNLDSDIGIFRERRRVRLLSNNVFEYQTVLKRIAYSSTLTARLLLR